MPWKDVGKEARFFEGGAAGRTTPYSFVFCMPHLFTW